MERKRPAPRPGRFCASRPPPVLQCQRPFIEHLLSGDSEEPATILTPSCPFQVEKSFPETLSLTSPQGRLSSTQQTLSEPLLHVQCCARQWDTDAQTSPLCLKYSSWWGPQTVTVQEVMGQGEAGARVAMRRPHSSLGGSGEALRRQ